MIARSQITVTKDGKKIDTPYITIGRTSVGKFYRHGNADTFYGAKINIGSRGKETVLYPVAINPRLKPKCTFYSS